MAEQNKEGKGKRQGKQAHQGQGQAQAQGQGGGHGKHGQHQHLNAAAGGQNMTGGNGKAARRGRRSMAASQQGGLSSVKSGKLQGTGGKAQVKHYDFANARHTNIQSVTYRENYRIVGAEHWRGEHYAVFRDYHPLWHDSVWWTAHYPRVVLIGGGWYYWNAGFWYPAWGYDPGAQFYAYDGPIYGYNNLPPDQVVANVQEELQSQGYYHGEVDGMLGPLTRAALADYQRDHNLYTTSAIDEPTMSSLGFS